ncbi:MAG: hypothetical protein CSB55_06420 [Candidatus Cloacimonadota bacterium]|nr:MAG: hypothetical protein CSB55_06420 [Candidatus Cloacimonadota bacterium]
MKKILFLLLALTSCLLPGEIFENENIKIENYRGLTKISNKSGISEYIKGLPGLPLATEVFELSRNDVRNLKLIPLNTEEIQLPSPVLSVQSAVPLSFENKKTFDRSTDYRHNPQDFLRSYRVLRSGKKNMLFVTFYQAILSEDKSKLKIPSSFKVIYDNVSRENEEEFPDNYCTESVSWILGKRERPETSPKNILYVYEKSFEEDVLELKEFNSVKFDNSRLLCLDEISALPGLDLQDKIRNGIKNFAENNGISHVTLIGDTDIIPDRKLFAFDCAYGLFEDENELPSDWYYSGLNGTWDANGNGIYGEDDDEPDYLPEVFVSRIPSATPRNLRDYIDKLKNYDRTGETRYNKAGGMSMALWSGSDSQVCQQFIYDNYFPEYFDIDFKYGEENSSDKVSEMLAKGKNIVQHTGHANYYVLSLQNGHLSVGDAEYLDNNFGGVLYSIGCWSAAIDKESIAEAFVNVETEGFNGYIGNSRYGWGAPSASAFGFSEFYQKEFFRLMFEEKIHALSELNMLSKLPFIGYYEGKSVFKWVGYELLCLADSGFEIYTESDPELYSLTADKGKYQVFGNGKSLPNVKVITDKEITYSDENGLFSADENGYKLYYDGYKPFDSKNKDDFLKLTVKTQNELSLDVDLTEFYTENLFYSIYDETGRLEFSLDNDKFEDSLKFYGPNEEKFSLPLYCKPKADYWEISSPEQNFSLVTELDAAYMHELPYLKKSFSFTANIVPLKKIMTRQLKAVTFGTAEEVGFELFLDPGKETNLTSFDILDSEKNKIKTVPAEKHNSNYLLKTVLPLADLSRNEKFYLDLSDLGEYEVYYPFIYNAHNEIDEDFNSDSLILENEWERFTDDGSDYWIVCRPENPGNYELSLGNVTITENTTLEFDYKFKMPMYGNDGVFFLTTYPEKTDTLLFLGSGGALEYPAVTEEYIYGDKTHYTFDISDYAKDISGEFKLSFFYNEKIPGFNEYAVADSIGTFIDNLKISSSENKKDDFAEKHSKLLIFPNPCYSNDFLSIQFPAEAGSNTEIKIFNIKGQLVWQENIYSEETTRESAFWNLKNFEQKEVASGIYLVEAKNSLIDKKKKITVIK